MGYAMAWWLLCCGLVLVAVGGFSCGDKWPDFCDGGTASLNELETAPEGRALNVSCAVRGVSGCTPYAKPLPPGTDWLDVRKGLVSVLFGNKAGELPHRNQPDFIEPLDHKQAFGNCHCLSMGTCTREECTRRTNVTKLVWTIEVPVNSSYTIRLNSTVFHSLNTSGICANNEADPHGHPIFPEEPLYPKGISDTLVIYHNGHACTGCEADHDGIVDWLNRLGFDTMQLHMPLYECNYQPSIGCNHAWFSQFDKQGVPVFRFFLEPTVLSINYAMEVLGYKRVVMTGLSGGGWTTTVMAAIDPRISMSLPVAGSIPCDFKHTSWDFEQFCNNSWAMVANYTSLYVLAALEPSRHSLQLIHEADNCCFHACHRHARIRSYNAWVQSQVRGNFATATTIGNQHEVNERDQALIATYIEKWRQDTLLPSDFNYKNILFSTLSIPDRNESHEEHVRTQLSI